MDNYSTLARTAHELRSCMKNCRFYLIDELWLHNEYEKKLVLQIMKDEQLMSILGIDPFQDEVLLHLASPVKYKPSLPMLAGQSRIVMRGRAGM